MTKAGLTVVAVAICSGCVADPENTATTHQRAGQSPDVTDTHEPPEDPPPGCSVSGEDCADGEGICQPLCGPGLPPYEFFTCRIGCDEQNDAPVCGCDEQTYQNPCEAWEAGAGVLHTGPCCEEPLSCEPGELALDTDGDGCRDTCELCPPGEGQDTNLDGSPDACCELVSCGFGVAVDLDGDLCPDSCQACDRDEVPIDSDGDGYLDSCSCNWVFPGCAPDETEVDTDGNGCPDACFTPGG